MTSLRTFLLNWKNLFHTYITKSQSKYFKTLKESSDANVATVSIDFSKIYSFTIQDEAQGHHWASNSYTVHPIIINLQNTEGEILVLFLCVLSDDMKHDVCTVYKIQETVTEFIKVFTCYRNPLFQ